MAARKLVYVLSAVDKSLSFEWLLPRLARDYDLKVVLLNPANSQLETFLSTKKIHCRRITLRGKRDFPFAFLRLFLMFLGLRPEVVHVHLLDAQRLALPAAWLARIRIRIYTRHTSTLHHKYVPSGIKYDKWSNWLATHIISLSQATDYALFNLEGAPRSKVIRVPHGFDFDAFTDVSVNRIEAIRQKWNIPRDKKVIGLVSRFIEWKGLQFALPAVVQFKSKYPDTCLVLANARGPFGDAVNTLLADFPPDAIRRIPFEDDVGALFNLFDIFIHVPIDEHVEAFGQVYIEALAFGIPSIFTQSGIVGEFIENGVHAIVVEHESVEAIERALIDCWENESLRRRIGHQGKAYVWSHFTIEEMVSRLKALYNG